MTTYRAAVVCPVCREDVTLLSRSAYPDIVRGGISGEWEIYMPCRCLMALTNAADATLADNREARAEARQREDDSWNDLRLDARREK